MLTAARLRELLSYDPDTGVFTWLVNRGRMAKAGNIAGHRTKDGYCHMRIDGKDYMAHRLAWLYMTGQWPTSTIDHADVDPGNDRWANLREATIGQNLANRRKPPSNTSGFKGVTWHSECRCWMASIKCQRRRFYLGLFDDPREAHAAYVAAAVTHFGEFARAA